MLHSMTGFARQSADVPIGALTWELRSVNHRYLDLQFKMPDELRGEEAALRQLVGDTVKRGKLECALHFRRAFDAGQEMQLDQDLVALLGERLAAIGTHLESPGDVNPVDILRWPGVIKPSAIDSEPLFAAASALLATAVSALNEMRASEGERIAAMIRSRCAEISSIAANVRVRMPEILDATRARQRERLEKLQVDADPERLELELALVAQKLDVDEEVDRLESHVDEILATLEKDEPVGRRLDFLMQELNREANTLGSKSADTETTSAAVELKVIIEQMREQIQNIE
ncbi:MAG TPA: YicC family protein [Woeseiaceae bacterium]|nr:YicC family protein [Woeseiaceae bacterium]